MYASDALRAYVHDIINPHNDHAKQHYYYLHFTDEEAEKPSQSFPYQL